MKDQEKLGIAGSGSRRGATSNKHTLRLRSLMEEIQCKAWFSGVCISLYLAKKGRYIVGVAVGCGLLQHLGKV